MDAALAGDGRARKEQVHQHGLATADFAVEIETLDRKRALFVCAKEPAKRGRFSRQPMLGEAILKADEFSQQLFLRPVALDHAGGDEVFVKLTGWHADRFFREAQMIARDKVSASAGQATHQ